VKISSSSKNLYVLSFTLLVVMLGYGIAMPMLPFYIERFGVGGREFGWMMSTYSLMQLICAPLWGSASDRVGRKPILAVGVLGYGIAFLLFGLAQNFAALFIARVLSGVLSSATMPTAMAYISDNSRPDEKSQAMGQLGAMIGLGTILGPLLGGLLSGDSISLPFFAGSGLAFLSFLLVMLFLPGKQQLPQATIEKKLGNEKDHLDPIMALLDEKKGFMNILEKSWKIMISPAGILLGLIFIMSFGLANFQNMIGLFVLDKFAITSQQISLLWMVMGAALLVVQGFLTGPLARRLGELNLIRLGLIGGALGFLLVALAGDFIQTLLMLVLFVTSLGLIGPALNAHISRYGGEHQGALMGLNSAMSSLGKVLGPLLAGNLYDLNIHYPFYSGAITLVLGWLISLAGLRKNMIRGN